MKIERNIFSHIKERTGQKRGWVSRVRAGIGDTKDYINGLYERYVPSAGRFIGISGRKAGHFTV